MKKVVSFLLLITILFTFCACGGKKETSDEDVTVSAALNEQISQIITEREKNGYSVYDFFEEAHKILGVREGDLKGNNKEKYITVYLFSLYGWYVKEGNEFENKSGGFIPYAMVFENQGDKYILNEYWQPRDGEYYNNDLKATFPNEVYEKIPFEAEAHNAMVSELESEIQLKLKDKYK